jgi:hypothetical protein
MADPTYVVVGYPSISLDPAIISQQTDVQRQYRFPMPVAQRALRPAYKTAVAGYSFAFGRPDSPLSLSPDIITPQDFYYKYTFFYPSNGTIPGSPIPRSGQVAPRPV